MNSHNLDRLNVSQCKKFQTENQSKYTKFKSMHRIIFLLSLSNSYFEMVPCFDFLTIHSTFSSVGGFSFLLFVSFAKLLCLGTSIFSPLQLTFL